MIDTVLYLIGNLLVFYVYSRYYRMFLGPPKKGMPTEIGGYLAAFAASSAVGLLANGPALLNLSVSVLTLLLISSLYAGRWQVKLLTAVLSYAPVMLIDVFGYYVDKHTDAHIPQMGLGLVITSVLAFALQLVIEKTCSVGGGQPIRWNYWLAVFALPLGSVAVILIAIEYNYSSEGIIAISMLQLGMTVLIFLLYSALGRQYESEFERKILAQQNQAYANQFQIIQQSTKNMRSQNHDFKNHLMALGGLLEQGDAKRALDYVREISKRTLVAGSYVATGNAEIDGILNYKLAEANELKAELNITVKLPTDLELDVFDLNVILGNLLDNAITAMKGCTERKLWLTLKYLQGSIIIEVKNTFDGVVEEAYKYGKKHFITRKRDKSSHGIGLNNVKDIVNKHHGFFDSQYDESIFMVRVSLPL